MAVETTTIQSDVFIVDPLVFVFDTSDVTANIPTTGTTAEGIPASKIFYQDAQLKQSCDHTLVAGIYSLVACPRCLGTGFYYDVMFDALGQLVPISNEDKLGQDLEKIMLTESNIFHSEYAVNLKKYIGSAGGRAGAQIVRKDIIDGINRLISYQKGKTQSTRENISLILTVDVDADSDPTRFTYRVRILTVSGEIKGIDGYISLV